MAKDCSNCIYKDREWGDNPCRTCDDECDNWVGVDDEESELKRDKCDNDHDCEHCDWVECPLEKENKQ